MPETQEGVKFDDMGICQACQSSEQKIHINWVEREAKLRKILEDAKKQAGNNYDCIVPISGGKDSSYQLHVLTNVYGMKPLAVTFSHNWWSKSGWYNLQNSLETFNVDHIMFTPNRALINRLARNSVERIGDTNWHDHAGVGAFPLHVAARFKIPLLIWGESLAENSGRATYEDPVHTFDREYFLKQSGKLKPIEMISESVSYRDLFPFELPTLEEIEAVGVWGIHLGDYIFWDDERQTEFLRYTYGWKETQMEGTYKRYKSVEDIMSGMHDFTCYLKRGYGRCTEQASVDVRNGLLTRDEGLELIRKHDPERPEALGHYLKITGSTEEAFYAAMEKLRVPQMRGVSIPVIRKKHKHEERLLPFPEQMIEKFNRSDAKRGYLRNL
ncbi:LPS biosynthesis protein [Candidatus Kaiserbacteria bacterium RIFCSPHIGHO2_12_FULL_53_13]|uniref:LPS biosynthesis protein n=1 Tax=Candidatus Kaiserbacteria bacterium RIFCSPHIGHO2_12_FULL_53_13 TaxID=1798502 RepID=A0A1F6E6L9_9BACT|nr:MAG: LPS biosynthesis protein [Candidatus Kaiserbacteria bacterium RIFCSPHIGHO2_12_FULL_53_13]